MKFEVGKKYKGGNRLVEVLFATETSVVVRYLEYPNFKNHEGREILWTHEAMESGGWKEYHEPAVVKAKRKLRLHDGYISIYDVDSDYLSQYVVGSVEFTVTDGKLTDVRIL